MPRHVEEVPEAVGGDAAVVERHRREHRLERLAGRRGRRAPPRSGRGATRLDAAAGRATRARSSTSASCAADAHALRPRRRSPPARGRAAARPGAAASAAPRRRGRARARSASPRRTSWRVCGVDAQAPVDRRREAELFHAPQREVDLLLVEERDELVPQARRREVADEVHRAAGAREVERVLVHAQAVPALVADGAQDARGVLDEAQVVEDDDAPGLEVVQAAEVVEEVAEGLGLERDRHRVDA